MAIQDIRKKLLTGLESEYTQENIEFIEERLEEIANDNDLSLEDLYYYCTANSLEMFYCICDYKEFDKKNFDTKQTVVAEVE